MQPQQDPIKNELLETAPTLAALKKQRASMPAHSYFEGMQQRVLATVALIPVERKTADELPVFLQWMLHLLQPKYAIPVLTVLILSISVSLFQDNQISNNDISYQEYLYSDLNEIETELLIAELSDADIEELQAQLFADNFFTYQDYLIENIDELNLSEEFL